MSDQKSGARILCEYTFGSKRPGYFEYMDAIEKQIGVLTDMVISLQEKVMQLERSAQNKRRKKQ